MQAATVAIIVRTIGHRHLTRAIASLLAQTHANLEIMLVVARPECDTKPSLLDPRVRVINTAVSLPRALAANRGLEATHADLIGFLDEDDWLAPAHVETLVAALTANPGYSLAYADTVIVAEPPVVMSRGYWKQRFQDFPVFTINAALFARSILSAGCRFDEGFDLLEDWDFWLQCAQLTDFLHVRATTAFYDPASGTSGTGRDANLDQSKSGPDKTRLQRKWLARYRALDAASGDLLRQSDALIGRNDIAAARAVLVQALAIDPGNPMLLNRLALCLHRLADTGNALAALRRACDVDRGSLDLYLQLAMLEQSCGERDAARETLEHARALATDADARSRVAALAETMRAT